MALTTPENLRMPPDCGPTEPERPVAPANGPKLQGLSPLVRNACRGIVVLLLTAAVGLGAVHLWRYFASFETTDDAQVDAHLTALSPRIEGTVVAVHTDDNQLVKAGQVIVEIDPRDYEVAVAQARADLSAARASLAAQRPEVSITSVSTQTAIATSEQQVADSRAALAQAEREYAVALASISEAEAIQTRSKADLARYQMLVDKDEVSRQQYDFAVAASKAELARVEAAAAAAQAARHQIDQRRATLSQAQARLAEVRANAPRQVSSRQSKVTALEASVRIAEARLSQALLNLSYCRIVAPVSGIIGRRTVEVGNRIQPGEELLYITQLDDIWITANFKETQFRKMRPGQRAAGAVDALGGMEFDGYVESTPGATGARFSLLPPENATGNYVKVVQRLPVRIRLKQGQDLQGRLRPGMSVEAKVWLQ